VELPITTLTVGRASCLGAIEARLHGHEPGHRLAASSDRQFATRRHLIEQSVGRFLL
jgi:hypothetical protein